MSNEVKTAHGWGFIGDFVVAMLWAAMAVWLVGVVDRNVMTLPEFLTDNVFIVVGIVNGMVWKMGYLPGTTEYAVKEAAALAASNPASETPNASE